MKKNTLYIIYVLSMCLGTADIPSVNIRSLSDLVQLSVILKDVHKKAKATTVCLDLGDGASGSGVVVSSSGLIMSAAHVTQEVDKELKVIFEDGTEYSAVGLGLDTSSDASLAQITFHENRLPLDRW